VHLGRRTHNKHEEFKVNFASRVTPVCSCLPYDGTPIPRNGITCLCVLNVRHHQNNSAMLIAVQNKARYRTAIWAVSSKRSINRHSIIFQSTLNQCLFLIGEAPPPHKKTNFCPWEGNVIMDRFTAHRLRSSSLPLSHISGSGRRSYHCQKHSRRPFPATSLTVAVQASFTSSTAH
jgi:hypothetical protein